MSLSKETCFTHRVQFRSSMHCSKFVIFGKSRGRGMSFLWVFCFGTPCVTTEASIEYMANTFLFLFSGVIMMVDTVSSAITHYVVENHALRFLGLALNLHCQLGLATHHGLKCMGLAFNFAEALVTW